MGIGHPPTRTERLGPIDKRPQGVVRPRVGPPRRKPFGACRWMLRSDRPRCFGSVRARLAGCCSLCIEWRAEGLTGDTDASANLAHRDLAVACRECYGQLASVRDR